MDRTAHEHGAAPVRFADASTRRIEDVGAELVYRELGSDGPHGVPLVGLTHLGANLDSWDPELVDPLAAERRVILLGYRGVGGSAGTPRDRFEDMAADAIAAIRALGLSRVDLFGLSMGGMVAQEILEQDPDLVGRVVLAGTGPQGGTGLSTMTRVFVRGVARGLVTFTPPTSVLFFTHSRNGKRAARRYQARLKRRTVGRDRPVSPVALRAQLRAVKRWGHQRPSGAPVFSGPVLVVHGDSDRLVPLANTDDLQSRFPSAQIRVFPDSGHGVVSQNRGGVADLIGRFLAR
jgi:pimeloyl-ACP methyl ester carboxylesterase